MKPAHGFAFVILISLIVVKSPITPRLSLSISIITCRNITTELQIHVIRDVFTEDFIHVETN